MMPSKNWTKIVIGLFSAIVLLTSIFTGESINEKGFQWISGAASAVIIMLLLYDKWIWRWPLIRRVSEMRGHPVLYGTWKGVIKYDKDGEEKPGEAVIYLSILQTYSSVNVRGYVSTSESYSITASLEHPRHTQQRLVYAYTGLAPHGQREKNRPFDGLAMINIIGSPVECLEGSYFTDRGGTGRLLLNEHTKHLSQSYNQAEKLEFH